VKLSSLLSILMLTLLDMVTIVPTLLIIAFYTLAERKAMGAIQRRRGPKVVGFWGLLQPIADGIKLVIKEITVPKKVEFSIYLLAPLMTFGLSLLN
jgi:NADH-quinone oxidoreductase subunit H